MVELVIGHLYEKRVCDQIARETVKHDSSLCIFSAFHLFTKDHPLLLEAPKYTFIPICFSGIKNRAHFVSWEPANVPCPHFKCDGAESSLYLVSRNGYARRIVSET